MKIIITIGLLVYSLANFAQTKIEKTIPAQTGNKLQLNFDYPERIKIQTWEKNEILIRGDVSINRGENDDAFLIEQKTEGNLLSITSRIKDMDKLPHRVLIKKGDQEYYFKAENHHDPEVQKFLEENGRDYTYMSNGVLTEITLEIFIPRRMESRIEALYGVIEVKEFDAPLTISTIHGGVNLKHVSGPATVKTIHGRVEAALEAETKSPVSIESIHGLVDISMPLATKANVSLSTGYGVIYVSPDISIDMEGKKAPENDFSSEVNGKVNGGGIDLNVSSTHNNIYVRRQ